MKNFGIRGEELVTEVGANAKMNEFAAVMGLCNLRHVETNIEERRKRHNFYQERLGGIKGIRLFDRNKGATGNYAYFPILIEDNFCITRDELYDTLKEKNIYARKYFYPLTSDEACFKNRYKNDRLNHARELAKKVLVLPFYAELEFEKMEKIVYLIEQAKS